MKTGRALLPTPLIVDVRRYTMAQSSDTGSRKENARSRAWF